MPFALYDLTAGRLVPEPIVDPDEAAEPMRGYPITRATSPDGRLAYTLYDGAGEHPFIHALDTMGRTAVCIDLHGLMGRDDLYDLRLAVSEDGSMLEVRDGSTPSPSSTHAPTRSESPRRPRRSSCRWRSLRLRRRRGRRLRRHGRSRRPTRAAPSPGR